jgi:amino acid adenylation domain-containing protein
MTRVALENAPGPDGVDVDSDVGHHDDALPRVAPGAARATSYSQQRMWVLDNLGAGRVVYNIVGMRILDHADTERIVRAIEVVVRRHDILRVSFHEADGAPLMRPLHAEAVPVETHELGHLSQQEQQQVLSEAVTAHRARPFDLLHEPPVRFAVYALAQGRSAVLSAAHHIAFDEPSMVLLGDELRAACDGLPLGPAPMPYADFAARERAAMDTETMQRGLDWWQDRLGGAPPMSVFPADQPVDSAGAAAHATLEWVFDSALSDLVRRMADEQDVTVSMAMAAACSTVLYRHTGQQDIVIGNAVSMREAPETQRTLGPFDNLLALRLDLSGSPTFRTLMARVRSRVLDARAYRNVPFQQVLERVKPPAMPDRGPLFQMALLEATADGPDAPAIHGMGAVHEIAWCMRDAGRGPIRCSIEYRSDLHSAHTIARIAAEVQAVFENGSSARDCTIDTVSLLSSHARYEVVRAFNATSTSIDTTCVTRQIERQARRGADAVAIRCGSDTVTFGQLDRRANVLARQLAAQGVGRGSLVGVCLDRSIDLVVALLGVLKTGAAYMPIDPAFPPARLAMMLDDSRAAVLLIADADELPIAPPEGLRCISVRRAGLATPIDGADAEPLAIEPAQTDAAYVIYTSGSTGVPKGVVVSHGALSNLLGAMRHAPGLSAQDVLAAVTTISFDIAGLEIYLPLTVGARIELAPRRIASDGAALVQLLADSRANVLQATPSTWRMLLESGWQGGPNFRALCGGEPLTQELADRLLTRVAELWNLYGPTETTIWSTADRVSAGGTRISIGRPIANTQVYVLDHARQPVPVGIPGELWIGGSGVAIGYHGHPELTAQRFVDDPFRDLPGARIYRTGDLGRWLPDGRLEHLGRLDQQVKVRGFRIEPGEIEAALAGHDNVRAVAVMAHADATGVQELVAYVVCRGKPTPAVALRDFASQTLPDYMVPSRVVFLAALPMTANGKVDVKALPPPPAAVGTRTTVSAPVAGNARGTVEVQLMALWRHVLSNDALDVHDNFFEHGGHSLKAAQLLSRIHRVFGRKLPLATLFEAPTVEAMTELLSREQWRPSWQSLVAINPGGSATPMFFIPGVGGNVLMFGLLARVLGPNQPLYGLQARGLDGIEPPFHSLREMASHYVGEVRSAYPRGPYVICGSCTGGVVAFEMAQQLIAHGEEVRLAILDTEHPSAARGQRWHARLAAPWAVLFVARKIIGYAQTLARMPPRRWPAFLRDKAAMARHAYASGPKNALQLSSYASERVVRATWTAVAGYEPKPYAGSLLNVLASGRPLDTNVEDTRRCWEQLAAKATSASVPSPDSGQLFAAPYVQAVAHILMSHLQ